MLSATVSLNRLNVPKVEFSFKDELANTLKEGFTAKMVENARKAYPDSRTPEQINAAFRKLVDPAAATIVKAGDFKAGVFQ